MIVSVPAPPSIVSKASRLPAAVIISFPAPASTFSEVEPDR